VNPREIKYFALKGGIAVNLGVPAEALIGMGNHLLRENPAAAH
jgi:hypothetical protein